MKTERGWIVENDWREAMDRLEQRTSYTTEIPSLNAQIKYWNDRWKDNSSPNSWQLSQGDAILGLVNKQSLHEANVLDIGCGTGWLDPKLSKFGKVQGLDLSETAIEIAKLNNPGIEFEAVDFFEVNLQDNSFDLIVAQEVIAHVYNQELFVEKVSRLLKPRGFLIITTVNKFVIERLELGTEPFGHIKTWLSRKEIERLFSNNFKKVDMTTVLPMGHKGILRFINSYKLTKYFTLFIKKDGVVKIKEKFGLGYTRIFLFRKKE